MNPPDDGDSLLVAKVCRSQGRLPEAEAALRRALALDPQNGCARIELGTLYEDQGKFAQAAAEFERAIAIEPNHGGAHCQLGRIYRRQGRLLEAEAALRKALELDAENIRAHVELGVLYEDQARFSQAEAELEKAVAIDRNNGWVYCQLGRIYRRQGRFSESGAALRKALELDPRSVGARVELGALYEDQGKLMQAAAECESAIAVAPDHVWAHCLLGHICRRQGRWTAAGAALHKALEFEPQNGHIHVELGALYEDQSGFMQAEAEFKKAIALDRNNGGAHGQLGRIYRRQGRSAAAKAALEKALELDPQSVRDRIELGALYEDQGGFVQAAVEFEAAIAIAPHDVKAHLCLGRMHLCLGRWDEAEAEFRKAAELDPRNDGPYVGLWAVHRGQGRAAAAEAALAQALAIDPQSASACAELLDRIDWDAAGGEGGQEPMRDRVFCLLPWTHLHIRTDGACVPCCVWGGPPLGDVRWSSIDEMRNSPGLKALRSNMMSGRPVSGCRRCYKDERVGLLSMRQRYNIDLSHHRGRERLTAPDGTLPRMPVPLLDIRFSNICNLRCRICDPTKSSSWAADARALGLPVEGEAVQKAYGDWDSLWRQLQPVLEDGIEEIAFVGGEPLVMEEHYRVLDFLLARKLTDVRLRYNTNFSTLRFQGRNVLDLWPRFREVDVVASLDGSGRRGEYMRKGLCWATVLANREEMLRRCPDVAFTISATVSIFNALHLPEFHREWVEKGYLNRNALVLSILRVPAMYRTQVLPAVLKERALESYRRHQESFLDAGGPAARDFAAAAHFLQAQDCSELLPEFVAMTRRLDELRGEDCREVFPELAALFEAAA